MNRLNFNECIICEAGFIDGEILITYPVCGHPFHLACYDQWLQQQMVCPTCKGDIRSNLLRGLGGNISKDGSPYQSTQDRCKNSFDADNIIVNSD